MTGIIFAAGIGSRLKPFTDFHPKALAEVGGVPMVVRVAHKLLKAGADRLIINLHHFPEQIVNCISRQDFADMVTFSDESSLLLDTGGALAKIQRELLADNEEPVVVHNADILTDFPICEMMRKHIDADADVTILTDPMRKSTRHFLFDDRGGLKGWENTATAERKPSGLCTEDLSTASFGGVHIYSPSVLKELGKMPADTPFSIIDWYIAHCERLKIQGYTPSAPYMWHDIGTTEKLAVANAAFN